MVCKCSGSTRSWRTKIEFRFSNEPLYEVGVMVQREDIAMAWQTVFHPAGAARSNLGDSLEAFGR